jgi:hypothetical protein
MVGGVNDVMQHSNVVTSLIVIRIVPSPLKFMEEEGLLGTSLAELATNPGPGA